MSKTVKIIPSWRGVGCKMRRRSGGSSGVYTIKETYPNMISYLSDGLDATYQVSSWASSSTNDQTADVLYINKTDFANQLLSALPNSATNIQFVFVARAIANTSSSNACYVGLTSADTIEATISSSFEWKRITNVAISNNISNVLIASFGTYASKSSLFDYIVSGTTFSRDDIVLEMRPRGTAYALTTHDVWVELTYDTTYPPIKVKVNGSWVEAEPYVKVNGTWEKATNAFVKVNGNWEEVT